MNSMSVKTINRKKVYFSVYKNKVISKMQIVQEARVGLSTVSQNLKGLEEEQLILREGYLNSTGGRRANSIVINKVARISIGLGLLKNKFHIIAIDLYGDLICSKEIREPFKNSEEYFLIVSKNLDLFITENNLENILGVSIAVQGILDKDKRSISYGEIMDNYNMSIEDIQKHIKYECRLEHDSKAAGTYELWNDSTIENAVVLLLNKNLGGAIITKSDIQNGDNMRCGLIEHMCIDKDGPVCYCGKKGCFETYCSINALKEKIDKNILLKDIFRGIREENIEYKKIWSEYLSNLAFTISNLNMIFDSKIILSGKLSSYLVEEDIKFIIEECEKISNFPIKIESVTIGTKGEYAPAIGAALYYIKDFLNSF